jgi:hypothetical protein
VPGQPEKYFFAFVFYLYQLKQLVEFIYQPARRSGKPCVPAFATSLRL